MAMVKSPFNGNLNPNEVFGSIFNMIISQQIMNPELSDNYGELVNKYKTDGGLYGDTKLFYSTDILESQEWKGDDEAANLLNIKRPADPKTQAIVMDKFRMITITVDNYLSKRAWSTEGVFSTFNGIILGMLGKTKRLYEVTLFNTYVGTTKADNAKAVGSIVKVPLSAYKDITDIEAKNRLEAQKIAEIVANTLVDMKDYSRDFNEYGFMRAYEEGQLSFIWNSKYINKITKLDLPTIFHKEGLVDKMDQSILPARYFGVVTDSTMTGEGGPIAGNKVQATAIVRSLVEKNVGGKHYFPGDRISTNTTVGDSTADFLYSEAYLEKDDIICKVVTNDTYKFMSAFEVGTNFFNSRSLTENHYLIWGYGDPDRLLDQPLVTVVAE